MREASPCAILRYLLFRSNRLWPPTRTVLLAGCGKLDLYTKCRWNLPYGADVNTDSGCSKRPSSKAAVSEAARRTLRYVEPLSDTRTPLADFFSILLDRQHVCRHAIGNAPVLSFSTPSV